MVISWSTTINKRSDSSQQTGFTLIELMIVVAIIGVLATIAYPAYNGYIERVNRAEMMSEMQQIASRIEANKINYKRYDNIPLTAVFISVPDNAGSSRFPVSGTALYTVTITPNDGTELTSKDWTITATPVTDQRMATDGTITLDGDGEKCRGSGTDKKCGSNDEWNK
ncbi:type IV pilin protein [Psychrobacter sp. M13]|uniref:type IV pilin protein n=1 Tax=Psychrobacter sp. M13 TaxID=3067275 RepID=UPI00273B2094|nr:type IV pilin protein [Psychrobacter sp. M13]WLP94844.1 type IV pilin protein [Psychrobacter sp. M13]